MSDPVHVPLSGWWWVSFTNEAAPKGERFAGTAIVEARGFSDAIKEVERLDLSPDEEVSACAQPFEDGRVPCEEWRNRFLSRGESYELRAWWDERWGRRGVGASA